MGKMSRDKMQMHGKIAREEKCMGNNTLKRKNERENRHLIGEMHRKLTIPRENLCREKKKIVQM